MLATGAEAEKLIGPILNARLFRREGNQFIVFLSVASSPKPPALKFERFDIYQNELTKLFEGATTAEDFVKVWKVSIAPQLSPEGIYSISTSLSSSDEARNRPLVPCGMSGQAVEVESSRKRPVAAIATPLSENTQKRFAGETTSRKQYDSDSLHSLDKYFVGQYKLPVSCLVKPSHLRQIRKPDLHFVSLLKEEMLANPTRDVAPIVGIVKLPSEEPFVAAHAEAYQYETVGGNHSRIALQEILLDCDMSSRFLYSHRLVSVYHGLSNEQVQHLAHCHNRATEFTSKMTTQDKIHLCRMRLYTLAEMDSSCEPPEKSTNWRNSCATTLMMTKKQLDENMVFLLSSLSNSDYATLQGIFKKYESGNIKKLSKAVTDGCTKADCKGSHFRGLRNLDASEISSLLHKVHEGELSLQKLNGKCAELKKVRDIKKKFIELVGVLNWEEATVKYPEFAQEEKLREKFQMNKWLQPLQDYCKRAMKAKEALVGPGNSESKGCLIKHHENFVLCLQASPDSISHAVLKTELNDYPGFSVSIFNVKEYDEIIAYDRMIRAVNTAAGLTEYFVIFHVPPNLELFSEASKFMSESGFYVELAYLKNSDKLENSVLLPVVAPFFIACTEEKKKQLSTYNMENLVPHEVALLTGLSEKGDYILSVNVSSGIIAELVRKERNVLVTESTQASMITDLEKLLAITD